MRSKKSILVLLYLLSVAAAVYLNWPWDGEMNYAVWIVNGVFFLLVGAILGYAVFGCLRRLGKTTRDLKKVTARIKADARTTNTYLWERYQTKDLFETKALEEAFDEYCSEMSRLENGTINGTQCDIEDYINEDLLDGEMNRGYLNLISGFMTGLGILGTFVGLTIGLQEFNAGGAAEIEQSIPPLMDGIKVAFHTSVFGVAFSMVYSLVFKSDTRRAELALREFLSEFNAKVVPSHENSVVNALLDGQERQLEGLNRMAKTMGAQIAAGMNELLTPQLERMNDTIVNFAAVATRDQKEALEVVVSNFVREMNRSLGDKFIQLRSAIEDTCKWQQENAQYMHYILERVGKMTGSIQEINQESQQIIASLSDYLNDIGHLQDTINANHEQMAEQTRLNNETIRGQQKYIEQLVSCEKQVADTCGQFVSDMAGQLAVLQAADAKAEEYSAGLERGVQALSQVSVQITEDMQDSIRRTFDLFDQNLAEIARHLSGTIAEIDDTLSRVPQTVDSSVESMERSMRRMEDRFKGAGGK